MRRKEAQSLFLLGQRAYGKGVYDKCVKILEKALGNIENGSSLGGEVCNCSNRTVCGVLLLHSIDRWLPLTSLDLRPRA